MAITQYMPDIPDDASMVDWPWTYEEFLPYFERAEHEWGVSGKANQAPAQEPMSPATTTRCRRCACTRPPSS